jgi:uncharacterized membrane protein YkoI
MRRGILALCAAVVLIGRVSAGEEKIDLDKVPAAVLEAVKKKLPDLKVTGAAKETEDGKTLYEVTGKKGKKNVDVSLTPAGEIVMIESEIAVSDLPKDVTEALEAKYPKAKIQLTEEVASGKDLKELAYELIIVTADKKKFELKFDPKGKILNTEEKKSDKD